MSIIDTLELTTVVNADTGYPIGHRTFERPPRFIGAPFILAQSAVPVELTGTTAETELFAVTVPGGLMGPTGSLRVYLLMGCTGSVNVKTMKMRFGATGPDMLAGYQMSGASTIAWATQRIIQNRGAENAQVCFAGWSSSLGVNNSANTVTSTDSAVDQVLRMTGQLAVAGEFLRLDGYIIEVLPGL